jgi:DNA-binding CsgD family transcriptional regulator
VATNQISAKTSANIGAAEAILKSYVASILAKLDLRDRVQAVVAAYESGLVVAGSGNP